MKTDICRITVAASLALTSTALLAQTSPWSVHVGPAAVRLHVDAAPEAPRGTPVPGGGLSASNSTTLAVEVGYDLTPSWTGRFTFGVPATTKVVGSGALAPVGRVGDVKYGPAVLSATYRLGEWGPFRPYVGGGLAFLKVFSSKDAGVSNFEVKNAWGSALQLGMDIPLSSNFGLFIDVKKIFLDTKVSGNVPAFGGVPAYAKVSLDPMVIQAGVSYRF